MVEYLKKKNRLFYMTAMDLYKEGKLTESLFYLKSDGGEEFFDLVALYFTDEEGYQRALFIPWPIIANSKSKAAKILREALALGNILESHIVSRDWHDMRKVDSSPPNDYYPPQPSPLYEDDYDDNVYNDYEDNEQ